MKWIYLSPFLLSLAAFGLSSCEEKGPMERAAEGIEDAADEAEDAIDESL